MGVRYSWLILVLAALPIAGERAESPLPKFEDRLALPDGRLVDCPPSILAATGAAEVRCFATSLEFRDLKKRVREVRRLERDEPAAVGHRPDLPDFWPGWIRHGSLAEHRFLFEGRVMLLVFDEEQGLLAVALEPHCAHGEELLDVKEKDLPRSIHKARPEMPEQARIERRGGTVVVEATIAETGEISEVCVLAESPVRYGFAESALKAIRQWRYEPTLRGGKPIAVRMSTTVTYEIH